MSNIQGFPVFEKSRNDWISSKSLLEESLSHYGPIFQLQIYKYRILFSWRQFFWAWKIFLNTYLLGSKIREEINFTSKRRGVVYIFVTVQPSTQKWGHARFMKNILNAVRYNFYTTFT